MLPAQQCLEAQAAGPREVDDRLVEHGELAASQRPAQLRLDPAPAIDLDTHLGLEMLELAASRLLRPVQRDVGMLEQVAGAASVARVEGDPDAAAGLQLLVPIAERLPQLRHDSAGDQAGIGRLAEAFKDQRELVTAEARHGVFLPALDAQAPRDLTQQGVAGVVAERVVHALEGVEIEQQQGHALVAPPAAADRVRQPVLEPAAVRQPGQGIVVGKVAHPLLGALALGDVDVDADQPNDPALGLYRRQDRLDIPPPVARAVGRLVAQRLAGQDPPVGLVPEPGHGGIDFGLVRPLAEMGAPMLTAGGVVHHVAARRIGDPEVEGQALDGGAQTRLGFGEAGLGALALADLDVRPIRPQIVPAASRAGASSSSTCTTSAPAR